MFPRRFISRPARWFRREDGSATIEFVIFFPFIMFLFLSSIELGVFLMRTVLLERAVDLNVRALRLGTLSPMTPEELKRRICEDALILGDCETSMAIELTPVSTETWDFPDPQITCVDRTSDIAPVVEFNPGTKNEIMLVRACVVADPFFATTSYVMDLPLDASGGYAIAAMSTFVNEP